MLVVVGGHSRNIGKTSVIVGLIRALRSRRWTALKITQYGHGVCSSKGEACGCEAEPDHPFALGEEYEPNSTDSGRFLAAGAVRSFWLRTRTGELSGAADLLRKVLTQNENVIVESNSVLELIEPDLFLMVLDFACADFKASSSRFMDRADAFVIMERGPVMPPGPWDHKPRYLVKPPRYISPELVQFVDACICRAGRRAS